jgi:KilA-N domain
MTADLVVRHQKIGEDKFGNLNLTDIWRSAGSPSTKATSNWRQLPTTDEYVVAVAKNLGKSYVKGENNYNSVVYSKSGRGGGTFAHILVAIGYAENLNPDLAVEIRATYLKVRTGGIPEVDEILRKADAARHHNEVRDMSKEVRKKYADTLSSHGAGGPAIGYCTDAIYQVLLGGTAKQLIKSRNLPATANVRATLPTGELLQTLNTEYLSAERIEKLEGRVQKGARAEAA